LTKLATKGKYPAEIKNLRGRTQQKLKKIKTRQPSSAGDKGEIEKAKCNNYMQGAGLRGAVGGSGKVGGKVHAHFLFAARQTKNWIPAQQLLLKCLDCYKSKCVHSNFKSE